MLSYGKFKNQIGFRSIDIIPHWVIKEVPEARNDGRKSNNPHAKMTLGMTEWSSVKVELIFDDYTEGMT